MNLDEFARVIELARLVYQVDLNDGSGHLVDPDHLRVDVCPPGVEGLDDADGQPTPQTWRVTFGEENDGDLARGEGATLAEAVADIRDAVEARAARLRALLAGCAP